MLLPVSMSVYYEFALCPQAPEEAVGSPGAELQTVVICHMWGLGIEPESYGRAASALNG